MTERQRRSGGVPIAAAEQARIRSLEVRVADLERELANIKQALEGNQEEEEPMTLRDVPRGQAKTEIVALLGIGIPYDPDEVADILSLDFSMVMDICEELVREGQVKYAPNGD